MNKLMYLIVFVIGLLFFSKPTFAAGAVRCETQYGGTQVCVTTGQLQINKQVFDPKSNTFVDNLGINDHKFSPGELLSFRINVKNVGDATLNNVVVTDTPQAGFLNLVTGALKFNPFNLAPGETKQHELKFRVVDDSKLPQGNVICIINAAEASADSNTDRDTAQLCLERKVLAAVTVKEIPIVKEMPKTGPEGFLLALFGSVSGVVAGARLAGVGRIKRNSETDYQMTESMIYKKGRGC